MFSGGMERDRLLLTEYKGKNYRKLIANELPEPCVRIRQILSKIFQFFTGPQSIRIAENYICSCSLKYIRSCAKPFFSQNRLPAKQISYLNLYSSCCSMLG